MRTLLQGSPHISLFLKEQSLQDAVQRQGLGSLLFTCSTHRATSSNIGHPGKLIWISDQWWRNNKMAKWDILILKKKKKLIRNSNWPRCPLFIGSIRQPSPGLGCPIRSLKPTCGWMLVIFHSSSSLLAPHLQSGAETLMASARISLVIHLHRAKRELDKVTGPNPHWDSETPSSKSTNKRLAKLYLLS